MTLKTLNKDYFELFAIFDDIKFTMINNNLIVKDKVINKIL